MARVSDPQDELLELHVPPEAAGERMDRWLTRLDELATASGSASRTRLQAWIREGRVELDGVVVSRPGQLLEAGQRVVLRVPPTVVEVEPTFAARVVPLVHEDEHIAVADKPAGLLTHRSPGGLEPALADFAAAMLGELPTSDGPERGGIVHRLDRDTSGLVVIARTAEALEGMQARFREHEVEKRYLAFVHGVPRFETDWIELPLGRDPRRPDRVSVTPEGEGREARTFYEVLERFDGFALLACSPRTGRMHQIRVHLAAAGLPIVADKLYPVRKPADLVLPPDAPDPRRHALHAAGLAFDHPITGARLELESPLPAELQKLLDWFRAARAV